MFIASVYTFGYDFSFALVFKMTNRNFFEDEEEEKNVFYKLPIDILSVTHTYLFFPSDTSS